MGNRVEVEVLLLYPEMREGVLAGGLEGVGDCLLEVDVDDGGQYLIHSLLVGYVGVDLAPHVEHVCQQLLDLLVFEETHLLVGSVQILLDLLAETVLRLLLLLLGLRAHHHQGVFRYVHGLFCWRGGFRYFVVGLLSGLHPPLSTQLEGLLFLLPVGLDGDDFEQHPPDVEPGESLGPAVPDGLEQLALV